ncbi:SGNH/GDSL hydrolase family protein [Burkholderia sp. 22PA0106]|uniref:SGNH/GDSL hydrolase family protein n=1 Tax=Burkholderia sp. 22PA0106 TaxID=3237371 RepID=UPI0039C3A28A
MHYSRSVLFARRAVISAFFVASQLSVAIAHASPEPISQPMPTGDTTLSPAGPLNVPAATRAVPTAPVASTRAARRGADTYTYLRCWYRIDANPLKPKSTYEWALDPRSGDWYRVDGYWWADGVARMKNMFYSTTTQDTLADVCRKTLTSKGIRSELIQAVAANNARSLNYSIWTIDSAQQPAGINKLIVFGDSLSDTQNMFNGSNWTLPNRTSWHAGRFSNGPVWIDYLAKALGLPMYNWATGGAGVDQYLVVPGIAQQVDSWQQYMDRAPDYRPGNTLFMVFAGANDLVNYGLTSEAAANGLRKSLDRLAAAGATNILLVQLPDVSRAPAVSARSDASRMAEQVKDYNRRLVDAATKLREHYGAALRIEVFDTYAAFNDLLNHPDQYGFDDVARSCLNIAHPSTIQYMRTQSPRADCHDPSRFVFWDTLHPTTHTHEWIAQRLLPFLQERFGL